MTCRTWGSTLKCLQCPFCPSQAQGIILYSEALETLMSRRWFEFQKLLNYTPFLFPIEHVVHSQEDCHRGAPPETPIQTSTTGDCSRPRKTMSRGVLWCGAGGGSQSCRSDSPAIVAKYVQCKFPGAPLPPFLAGYLAQLCCLDANCSPERGPQVGHCEGAARCCALGQAGFNWRGGGVDRAPWLDPPPPPQKGLN